MIMKVFVTGASGFIGSHVTKTLLMRNHSVTILATPDDPMTRLHEFNEHITTIRGTLEDTDLLGQSLERLKPDACIHLAWYTEPGKYLDSDQNIQSLNNSLSLFRILISTGCPQIVAAGTCFEYDTDYGYLREDTPTHPASLYAATKLSCFLLGNQMATQAGIRFAWGRIFYPYGPQEDRRRLVPSVITALKQEKPFPASPGAQVRDYIHVSDVATALCTLFEKRADGIFNISTGSPVSISQLLKTIGSIMNKTDLIQLGTLPYRNWEPPFICGDNSLLRSLDWEPFYSLPDGLLDAVRAIT